MKSEWVGFDIVAWQWVWHLIVITFEAFVVFKSVECAAVAIGVIDTQGWQQFEDLFLDGTVSRVQSWRQFSHIFTVLNDVI